MKTIITTATVLAMIYLHPVEIVIALIPAAFGIWLYHVYKELK